MASSGLTCKYTSCLQRWKCQISAVFLRHISQQVLISLLPLLILCLCVQQREIRNVCIIQHTSLEIKDHLVSGLVTFAVFGGATPGARGSRWFLQGPLRQRRCWRPAGTRCPGTPPLPGRSGSDPQTPLSFSVLGCPAASGMLTGVVLEV